MLTEFKLPGLGENIASGVVTKVMVKAGDAVKKDQMIIELETDKAVLEVPSPYEGVVKEVLVAVGKEAKVGQVILRIDVGATAGSQPAAEPKTGPETKPVTAKSPEPAP